MSSEKISLTLWVKESFFFPKQSNKYLVFVERLFREYTVVYFLLSFQFKATF